jgi:SET domain-containing protein
VFGLGSLFNHSTLRQNVGWIRDITNQLITYKTLREIKRGEELCISYGDRLTFVDADAKEMHGRSEEGEGEDDRLMRIELV